MASPFPGMDPYLEAHWGDVHQRLAIYASNALQGQLPSDLRARTEERIYVEQEERGTGHYVPDVSIAETQADHGERRPQEAAVLEPVAVAESERVRESFVTIREKGGGRIVTVIEFLSPTNKIPGSGREMYLCKQRELQDADVHLLQIDLVRAGRRVFEFPGPLPPGTADQLLAHIRKGDRHRLFAFDWRERLPVLPVPLRYEDEEVTLDLQALHDQCYRDGAYDDIDYAVPPDPPLEGGLAEWVEALLGDAGRR